MKIAKLLFELGRLQVFWYPTEEDIKTNADVKDVYWQDRISRNTFGPFDTVYQAMNHYAWLAAQQPGVEVTHQIEAPKREGKVIMVDFKNRKKIQLPEGTNEPV